MIAYILNTLIIAILTVLRFADESLIVKYDNNPILRNLITGAIKYKFEIAGICIGWILIYTLILQWIKPWKGRKK